MREGYYRSQWNQWYRSLMLYGYDYHYRLMARRQMRFVAGYIKAGYK